MANAFGSTATADMDRWMRQLWQGWQQAAAGAVPGGFAPMPGFAPFTTLAGARPFSVPGLPDWQQSLDWWTRQMHGNRGDVNDMVARFHAQVHDWFGKMQQIAAQFSVQPGNASQIVERWREAVGASGTNPFPEVFRNMRGHGMQGMEQWMKDAAPWLDAWRNETREWLSMPTIGLFREHQEHWQQLAESQMQWQQRNAEFTALLGKVGEHAFELFENTLVEHDAPGRQITTARALFDAWIDACEEAYAQIALSPEFRRAYGALVNAQMGLRLNVQRQVEQLCESLGMPTRSEVDAAHRKVAQLERQLRRLQAAWDGGQSAPSRASAVASPSAATASTASADGTGKASPAQAARNVQRKSASTGKGASRTSNDAARPGTKQAPKKTASKQRSAKPAAKTAKNSRNAKRSAIPATAMPMAPEPLKGGKKKRSR